MQVDPANNCFPLASPQREIWFDQLLHCNVPLYNIGGYMRIVGCVDAKRFEQAVAHLVQKHDVLRTVLMGVRDEDGLPMQAYAENLRIAVAVHDFSASEDPHAAAMEWMQQRFQEPFDLCGAPLFRYAFLKISPGCCYGFCLFHHLIADGWTIALLARSLADIYTALEAKQPVDLQAPSYLEFVADDRVYFGSPACKIDRQYWLQKFSTPYEPLFAARRQNGVAQHTASSQCSTLPLTREWYDRLIALARKNCVTTFHVILGALYVYFVRTAQCDELVVGLPVLNRRNAASKATAGLFVGISPARFEFGVCLSFGDLLQAIGRELKENYRHQRFPIGELSRALGRVDAVGRALFDLSVSYERQDYESNFGAARGSAVALQNAHQQVPLTLFVREFHDNEAVQIDFVYHTAYFDGDEIEAIQKRFVSIVDFVQQHEDASVAAIPLLTAAEIAQTAAWNDTCRAYPSYRSVLELFSQQVERTPQRGAVVCDEQRVSYRKLDEQANRLARFLIERHAVAPDTPVGLCMERSAAMIVGMLGILKAGGAYVPFDPTYPTPRLRDMQDNAGVTVMLTQHKLIAGLASTQATLICLNTDSAAIDSYDADAVARRTVADNLAYVIYTSGSTGQPKGAAVTHGNLLHSTLARTNYYAAPAGNFLLLSSVAFDSSVAGIFWTLCQGDTLCLPLEGAHNDLAVLARTIEQQAISRLLCIPSLYSMLLDEASPGQLQSLSTVIVAGEVCPADLVLRHHARLPGASLFNEYGPAEASVWSTVQHCRSGAKERQVPIGRPIDNVQIHLLDEYMEPVPLDVPAELYIGGAGIARGYLHRPDLTAERFLPSPFGNLPGARLYRTGDLARYRADGVIEFLGRRDHQIKIRGQRVELGDVETHLRQHSAIADAVVTGHVDSNGETRVVAYWVASGNARIEQEELRRHLAGALPHHMMPACFERLDRLPQNANGKVDRKALPAPDLQRSDEGYSAPQTPTEALVAGLWQAVLKRDSVGAHDHFFHAGGHSLLATQLMAKVRKAFNLELPLRTIFEAPTVRALALHIDQRQAERKPDAAVNGEPELAKIARNGPLPLSFAQQRLWFLDQFETGGAVYNMAGCLRLTGALNVEALAAALSGIVARHEVLRTRYDLLERAAVQEIAAAANVPFPHVDLSVVCASQRETEARRLAEAKAALPFDLRCAPLLRARLLRLDRREHWLVLTLHHIAADGWSMGILLRELAALYRAHDAGVSSGLPALPLQYADFAVWQRAWLQGAQWELQLGYWRRQLAGAPALLDLPTDHPRPAAQSYRGGRADFALPPALTAQLHVTSRCGDATLFMTLLGAFGILLARYSAQHDICIGTPIANRQRAEIEGLVGCFVNTLVLRLRFGGNPGFAAQLQKVRETALGAYAHQDMPFEQLVEALQPERHLRHAPLFQVMFALQNNAAPVAAFGTLQVQPLAINVPIAKFDLTLSMREGAGQLHGAFEYRTDLFEPTTVERMIGHFRTLLGAIAEQPDAPVWLLPLLPAEERELLLFTWNRTKTELPAGDTIHGLFEAQAARTPNLIAVVCEDARLTYGELNERANRLAHYLRTLGVGPDVLVGLCVERSLDMIVGVFGVLKAGGAYLPLDPALPEQRIGYMIQDAGPRLVLTQRLLLNRLPAFEIDYFCLDEDPYALAGRHCHNPLQRTLPEHLAYVIYTSGSSGKPKGTLIHHRALVNLALAQISVFELRHNQRVLQWASFNFDASVSEIFTTLCCGASLYLASREAVLPGHNLLDTLRRHCIELVTLTPSALAVLPHEALPDLRTLVVAGEKCDHALIAPWLKTHIVVNAYGPTEATVCATAYTCSSDGQRHPPIGRPIANTRAYVLDDYLNPVPQGVIGQLYIAGEGLALGYLGRPDLTAERFIQNPFGIEPGERMYQTGDQVRYLAHGQIEYVGRIDRQVKIRGYRIELGEIEFALDQLPSVRESVVLVRTACCGDQRLVAYVVPASDPVDPDNLRVALRRSLPGYMMPVHFVALDKLPINTSGKVDRTALDALKWDDGEHRHETPRTPTEQRVAQLWAGLLACEQVGRNENFFRLGGHSLLAVKLCAKVKEMFYIALPVSQIFLSPTLAEYALAIDGVQPQPTLVVPLQ